MEGLPEFKYLCFKGKAYYWVDIDRYHRHKRAVFDIDWKPTGWMIGDYEVYSGNSSKPQGFDKMVRIAEILSTGFTHVRVDLYNLNGVIRFGEMTFTNGSGFIRFEPDSFDMLLGKQWHIDDERA